MSQIFFPLDKLFQIQTDFLQKTALLLKNGPSTDSLDRRFSSDLWRAPPFFFPAVFYSLNANFMDQLAKALAGDAQLCERVRFAVNAWIDATSPENFLATNPDAQKKILETQGGSLRCGLQNFLSDLERGRVALCDQEAFSVGKNVAATPGAVVFQNDWMQLIQYRPQTEKIGSTPLLIVPPFINKYYVLDLQKENSLVAYLVSQGISVFLISWRNADTSLAHSTWDDYVDKGVFSAIRTALEISQARRVNAMGFCVGGTLLSVAAAVLAKQSKDWLASITLLTTLLDFSDSGMVGTFIDEPTVQQLETQLGQSGILSGKMLSQMFLSLRPRDLFWSYVVKSYLNGESPPSLDFLFWNNDVVNLPGPLFCWYLRHLYLKNELRIPDQLACCHTSLDLSRIQVPVFAYASREDHIVPWTSAYHSVSLFSGPKKFILGGSGHIAGVINPPQQNRRQYWENVSASSSKKKSFLLPKNPSDWFEKSVENKGSWWPVWVRWLRGFSGEEKEAPLWLGSLKFPVVEAAPGRYVFMSADAE